MTGRVHIIAEAGTTHEGNATTALESVRLAQEAGADSIKFQFIEPEELYLGQIRENGQLVDNPPIAARTAQKLSDEQWRQVAQESVRLGIPFSASVFGPISLGKLKAMDPPYIKIASTDTTNIPLIELACETEKTVLLSTGMSDLGEIEAAVNAIERCGAKDVVLLHCVSAYPCPVEAANIGFVRVLREAFGLPVGYSDHTETSVSAIAAVALGTTWIEKHMTQDRASPIGYDHSYAMEPQMLTDFIADIRACEAALAVRSPKVGEAEAAVKSRARRGLWAARDLPAGHVVTAADILPVRPAGPLSPADAEKLVGRTLAQPILKSEPFRLEIIEP
ncbi:MAG: N-acetylneuraminate synthase family protein [Hoeflea sp.]|uniref:N-acetylneuraminate synthase family protein n=1 Tax=Hoeflea sp. TaxID=1940281 RepID=UPI00329A6821